MKNYLALVEVYMEKEDKELMGVHGHNSYALGVVSTLSKNIEQAKKDVLKILKVYKLDKDVEIITLKEKKDIISYIDFKNIEFVLRDKQEFLSRKDFALKQATHKIKNIFGDTGYIHGAIVEHENIHDHITGYGVRVVLLEDHFAPMELLVIEELTYTEASLMCAPIDLLLKSYLVEISPDELIIEGKKTNKIINLNNYREMFGGFIELEEHSLDNKRNNVIYIDFVKGKTIRKDNVIYLK